MKRLIFSALIFAVTAPVHAGLFDRTPKPVTLEAQGNRAGEFKQLVSDDSALEKVAKVPAPEPTKVAIAKIRMNFATQTSAASTENRGLSGGKSSQYTDYTLINVQPDDVQKIVDLFYSKLAGMLSSKGYQVQPQDYLMGDNSFSAAVAQTKSPATSEALLKKEITVTALAKQTVSFSGMNDGYMDFFHLSQAKGDALILELDFDVDFVTLTKASDKGVWFQAKQIEDKPGLYVKKGYVRVHSNGKGTQFAFVEKAILTGDVFAKVEKQGASTGDVVGGVLSALMGNLAQASHYNVTPVENFPEAVSNSLQPFAEVVINALPQPVAQATAAQATTEQAPVAQ